MVLDKTREVADQFHTETPDNTVRAAAIIAIPTAAAKLLQSCPTLCDPIDGSQPAPPSLGFSRQEQWNGLPFPSPVH